MRRNLVFIGCLLAAILALMASSATHSIANQATPEAEGPAFVGAWQVTFVIDGRPTANNLTTFTPDGIMLTANLPSAPALPERDVDVTLFSAGHGTWISSGEDTVDITFVILQGDLDGNDLGSRTIRGSLKLDPSGETWSGSYTATIADASGQELRTSAGNVEATRIVVEPMVPLGTPVSGTPTS